MEEKDINLVDVLSIFKKGRKTIIITTAVFFAIGVFLALFSPRSFKAECIFVPQTNQSFSASKYSSIASMMGMDLDMSGSDGPISPKVYPNILENKSYLKDLMYTPIHFEKSETPITIYDYCTHNEYRKFNLVSTIEQYTIGLPFMLLGAIMPDRSKHEKDVEIFNSTLDSTMVTLTYTEDKVARFLKNSIDIDVDAKNGFLTYTAIMPEALASAEVCQTGFDLLKQYVSDFKLAKSKRNLSFIEEQHNQAKDDYDSKRRAVAYYVDSHKGIMTAASLLEQTRLESDAELAKQLYQELAKNLLSSRVKLEEDNVTFTELAPVAVPARKFKPRGTVLTFVWTFLGLIVSAAYVWIKASVRKEED